MRKIKLIKQLIFLSCFLLFNKNFFGQTVSGKLQFDQGKMLNIQMEIKSSVAQQPGGQAINFTIEGMVLHSYKVMNATPENTTLQHQANKIVFSFDGMGQKRSFDSDVKNDMEGPFGETVKNILNKNFDMVIDPNGKVMVIRPDKIEPVKTDDRSAIVFNMLKGLTD